MSNNYLDISQGSEIMSWIQSLLLLDKEVYVSYGKQLTEPDIVLTIGRKEAMAGGEDFILDAEPFVNLNSR